MPWYRYSSLPGGHPQPLVRVHLWHGTRRVQLVALVDSGADSSLIDASYAPILGLDEAHAEKASATTASGDTVACLRWPNARLEIQFEDRRFPLEGQFIEFPPGSDPLNLLGRADFFRPYTVQFWDAASMMHIDLAPQFFRQRQRLRP